VPACATNSMLTKGFSRSTPSQAAANRADTNQSPVPLGAGFSLCARPMCRALSS
jgi:hypothetical protein